MTEEIIKVAISLLAVYGLSCIVMRIVEGLMSCKDESSFVIVPITDLSQITDRIMWAKLRFEPMFKKNSVKLLVVDCGLDSSQSAVLERYCRKEGLVFCLASGCQKVILDNVCKADGNDV